jgi:ATP-dependent DNA helicase DinG
MLHKGAAAGSVSAQALMRIVSRAPAMSAAVVAAANALLRVAGGMLKPARKKGLCRYKVDGVRMYSLHALFKPYESGQWDENALKAAQDLFEAALASLVNLLHELCCALEDADGEGGRFGDLSVQAASIAESLTAFANDVNFVLCGERPTHAYWIEKTGGEGKAPHLRLVAAPLSVAGELREMFYEAKDSTVLCSATFRVGNDFRYMARRLGCDGRFRSLVADSPFDYFRQSLVLSPDCLPDPALDGEGYAAQLAGMVRELVRVARGRTLVLFTSYEMMNAVAGHARQGLCEDGRRLLVQGEGMSREAMTRELKNGSAAAVFGAQSFWEGVDVAGEALSCVVLARLPFAQIGDPVVEARSEKIDREGGSSFRDYALPEAVIKFRQGFGRLIRTKSDRGVVVVADPRIVTKNYGAVFRKSIPATVHTVCDAGELYGRVREFL